MRDQAAGKAFCFLVVAAVTSWKKVAILIWMAAVCAFALAAKMAGLDPVLGFSAALLLGLVARFVLKRDFGALKHAIARMRYSIRSGR